MSRSRRKSPFVGHTTAESDKEWKQQDARKMRRSVRQLLGHSADGDAVPVSRYAKGDADRDAPKDGKRRLTGSETALMRK
jgi:hypothetical protein